MITGNHSPCHYAAGSQLNAAVDFLEAHVGEVAFVTIDIGANDIVGQCFGPSGLIPTSCVADLRPGLKHRVRAIVDALATAAPGVPIVGMRYYDPFLGLWGLVPGGRALAHADQRAWTVFNDALTSAYEHAGASVADVATTFRIDDFDHTVVVPGRGRVPVNVALACRWTWFCSAEAHVRRARESNRLPQDRDHVPPGPEAAAPDLGPIFERTRRFRRAALRGTSRQ